MDQFLEIRKKRQPLALIEVVDDLFPANDIALSEEQLAFYRAVGPFAFASDRQSLDDVLKDRTKTGQETRVQAILRQAELLRLHMPVPRENPNWLAGAEPQPGEIQYFWGDPQTQPFWFVDGVGKRASGYVINKRSRPELWRAYHTAIRLAEAGCAVRAFIVGEPTRFFRSPKWINLFWEGLASKKIALYVVPFGEITEINLSTYMQYVNALSGRIQEYRKQAMAAYQRRGKVFHQKCAYGLRIDRDDEQHPVQADPAAWPVLADMCHQVAEGRLKRLSDVRLWLKETHGLERSMSWLSQLLRSRPGILDGVYEAYRYQFTPCEREDPSGLVRDIAVTEQGNRRYKKQIVPGTLFDIYYPEGTQPIPAEVVDAARLALVGRRGRPTEAGSRRASRREQVLLSARLLRCRHCGCGLSEYGPGIDALQRRCHYWYITCPCVPRLVERYEITWEQAKQHDLAQSHPLYFTGQVSGPMWTLLVAELTRQAPVPRQEQPDTFRERERLKGLQRTAQQQLEQLTINFLTLSSPSPQVVRITEERQRALEHTIQEQQQAIQMLAAQALDQNRRVETFAHYQRLMGGYLNDPEIPAEKRREIVEHMVEQVVLDMATGEFTVQIRTPEPVLRRGRAEICSFSRECANIVLFGQARRGLAKAA